MSPVYRAKPGFFGRPWAPNTGEAVLYKATVETSNYPGSAGISLISPPGWTNSLGATSDQIYEYSTLELSGTDNSANRVSWSKVISTPFLTDGTEITPFNFTKGNDNWDPFNLATLGTGSALAQTSVNAFASGKNVYISNVTSPTQVKVYGMNGSLIKTFKTSRNTNLELNYGLCLISLQAKDGLKTVKVLIR